MDLLVAVTQNWVMLRSSEWLQDIFYMKQFKSQDFFSSHV